MTQLESPPVTSPDESSAPRRMNAHERFARLTETRRRWRGGHQTTGRFLDALGAVIVIVAVLAAIIGPLIAPDVYTSHIMDARLPPSAEHWFGTDDQGRDIFWRVLVGARTTLFAAGAIVVLYSIIGVMVAVGAVLSPKWLGDLIMRGVDVMQAFPALIFALLIAALMGPSLWSSIVALAATGWVITARLLAGIMRETMHEPYVEAARTLGVHTPALMTRHVLPNALPALWVKWAGDMGMTILLIGAMSFIGAGAQPPSAEWGAMVLSAKSYITTAWWAAFFPGLAIAVTSMGFALVGDAFHHRQVARMRGH
ncbi:ABC transporter permease [Microbacter sp. GSS18]|nr:ABC transporter permease [Microbacter sp. GSS18]